MKAKVITSLIRVDDLTITSVDQVPVLNDMGTSPNAVNIANWLRNGCPAVQVIMAGSNISNVKEHAEKILKILQALQVGEEKFKVEVQSANNDTHFTTFSLG